MIGCKFREQGLQIFHDFVLAPERLRLILRLLPDSGSRSDNINTPGTGAQHPRFSLPAGPRVQAHSYGQMHACPLPAAFPPRTAARANTHPHSYVQIHAHTLPGAFPPAHRCTCKHTHTLVHTDAHVHAARCIPTNVLPHVSQTHTHTLIHTDALVHPARYIPISVPPRVHTDIHMHTLVNTLPQTRSLAQP